LRIYKIKLRIAHDKFSAFEIDFLFELNNSAEHELQFPAFLWLLVKRLIDSGYCERICSGRWHAINNVDLSPDIYRITADGVGYIEQLGAK